MFVFHNNSPAITAAGFRIIQSHGKLGQFPGKGNENPARLQVARGMGLRRAER
jgi:hypothetical protein